MTTKPTIDPDVERDSNTVQRLKVRVGKVLVTQVEDQPKSEKRTATLEELDRRWKLTRRDEG